MEGQHEGSAVLLWSSASSSEGACLSVCLSVWEMWTRDVTDHRQCLSQALLTFSCEDRDLDLDNCLRRSHPARSGAGGSPAGRLESAPLGQVGPGLAACCTHLKARGGKVQEEPSLLRKESTACHKVSHDVLISLRLN